MLCMTISVIKRTSPLKEQPVPSLLPRYLYLLSAPCKFLSSFLISFWLEISHAGTLPNSHTGLANVFGLSIFGFHTQVRERTFDLTHNEVFAKYGHENFPRTEPSVELGGSWKILLMSANIKGPGWIITRAGPITQWLIGPEPHTVWENISQSVQTQCQHGVSLMGPVLPPYPGILFWPLTFPHVQLQNTSLEVGGWTTSSKRWRMLCVVGYGRSLLPSLENDVWRWNWLKRCEGIFWIFRVCGSIACSHQRCDVEVNSFGVLLLWTPNHSKLSLSSYCQSGENVFVPSLVSSFPPSPRGS